MTEPQQMRMIAQCGRVFSPSAPVNSRSLFAGRLDQIERMSEAINSRGRHAIMYGDRGVGKTSLANILRDLFSDFEGVRIVKTNCNALDAAGQIYPTTAPASDPCAPASSSVAVTTNTNPTDVFTKTLMP